MFDKFSITTLAWAMVMPLLAGAVALLSVLLLAAVLVRCGFAFWSRGQSGPSRRKTVVFFHPYSEAMGGGERVLYAWISQYQK